jgi:hypothetical protein
MPLFHISAPVRINGYRKASDYNSGKILMAERNSLANVHVTSWKLEMRTAGFGSRLNPAACMAYGCAIC